MDTTACHNTLLGRAIIGAISGAILGFIIEPLCFWGGPPEHGGIRIPVVGPATGAGICLAFALVLGGVPLRGIVRHTAIGTVAGIIAGILIGASLFPAIMTSLDPLGDSALRGKIFASHQRAGIPFGIPIGAAIGMTVGIIYGTLQRKRRTP